MIVSNIKSARVLAIFFLVCQSHAQPDPALAEPEKGGVVQAGINVGIITTLVKNGKTYEFSRTSLEEYEVTEVDGERLCRFDARLPENSPGLDHPRLVDVFREANEAAMLFFGGYGFFYLHSSKEPPPVGKGQLHLELLLLAKDCWHIRNFVYIRDFYPEQMKELHWDGKVKSAKVVGLNSFEVMAMEGEGARADRFSFKIDPSGEAAFVKNGKELNYKVVAGSTVVDADLFITQIINPETPADQIRDLVISVAIDRESFIEKLDKVIDDREKMRLVTARIDHVFRLNGE